MAKGRPNENKSSANEKKLVEDVSGRFASQNGVVPPLHPSPPPSAASLPLLLAYLLPKLTMTTYCIIIPKKSTILCLHPSCGSFHPFTIWRHSFTHLFNRCLPVFFFFLLSHFTLGTEPPFVRFILASIFLQSLGLSFYITSWATKRRLPELCSVGQA
jgi:hypothetical protein